MVVNVQKSFYHRPAFGVLGTDVTIPLSKNLLADSSNLGKHRWFLTMGP